MSRAEISKATGHAESKVIPMKISLYINYFNPAYMVKSGVMKPIQTGCALSKHDLPTLKDNVGDNISGKNASYCELTGQYWVWKNDKDSDYVGFVHYRRFFDFFPERGDRVVDSSGLVIEDRLSAEVLAKYGLTDHDIERCVVDADMILPEPWNVAGCGATTIYSQYRDATFHHIKDLDLAGEIIYETCPEYYGHFKKVMDSEAGLFTNMFVFKREIFEEYSAWLFPLLAELERRIDVSDYGPAERRVIGYIAERMVGVFVSKKLADDKNLRVKYLRRVFVKDTSPTAQCPPLPVTDLRPVSVVAATDSHYVAHMAALIASVFSNAAQDRFIDFLVLDGGMTELERRGLQALERLHPHAKISFIDMSMQFLDIDAHMYFTRATFYRLALPEIVYNRSKILFLDTDAVVIDDVAKIFDTELDGKSAAAVKDVIMASFVAMGVRSMAETGGYPTAKYLSDVVGMKDQYRDYFQAGLILFNLERLRENHLCQKMISDLKRNRYWFLDQDILNKYLVGDVKFLDLTWNSVSLPPGHGSALPVDIYNAYLESRKNPSMLHYAGAVKPWNDPSSEFAQYYWFYLRMTLWYEDRLLRLNPSSTPLSLRRNTTKRRIASAVWRRLPGFLRRAIFPLATALDQRWKD